MIILVVVGYKLQRIKYGETITNESKHKTIRINSVTVPRGHKKAADGNGTDQDSPIQKLLLSSNFRNHGVVRGTEVLGTF